MTMNPTSKKARLAVAKKRSRERGAALVEAAVVIPVMLVFLGLTMWIHNSYDEKLASQTSTRAQVLYYASHNCDEEVPSELAVQLGTKTSGSTPGKSSQDGDTSDGNAGAADHASEKLGGDTQEGLKRSWNLVKTHRDTSVAGTAVQDRQKVSFSVPIASNSEAACNEKRFDNSWTAVFGFIKGYIRSGGGIVN
jgi:hypothetical protein